MWLFPRTRTISWLLVSLTAACADDDAFRETAQQGVTVNDAGAGETGKAGTGAKSAMRTAVGTRAIHDAGSNPESKSTREPKPKQTTMPASSRMMPARMMRVPQNPVLPSAMPLDDDAGIDDADGGASEPSQPQPQDCMGKRGAPGTTTRTYEGRSYIVHIPPKASPNTALPVMMVFHGSGGTGEQMENATGFDGLADQVGLVTIYPNGQMGNAPWNVGRNVCPPGNFVSTTHNDIAYVEHILDDVEQDQCLDRKRIFATGFSMGGYFVNELGCRVGHNLFRAIAAHSGGTHGGPCPGAPVPTLILHGDSDSLINYRCGTQARDLWVERNGCSKEFDRLDMTGGYCDYNRDCPPEASVVMCTFNGLDHAWAYPPMYANSGVLIWLFFSQFK